MKNLFSITLILLLSSGLFTSCKKDNGDPPSLPPMESMTIDFSNFTSSKKGSDVLFDQKGIENSNWEFAASVAGIWNTILTINLAVPVTSFKLAVDQDPVFLENKTWQWSYNVSVLGVTYKARLTGQIMTSDVEWTMYVSSDNISEFIWFKGTSELDGTGGRWTLNESADSPTPLLQIDWTKTSSIIGSIKYTYVKNTLPFNTSYIEYGLTTGDLDAFYTIHYYDNSTKAFSDVNIKWNTTTNNGSVSCSDYLEGKEYCWDSNKINIVCP
jgi:hypothetical protein